MGSCGSKDTAGSDISKHKATSNKRQQQSHEINQPHHSSSESSHDGSTGYNEKTQGLKESLSSPEEAAESNMTVVEDNGAKEVKILLLGSGESGKSTIVKQMKILHQNGYTTDELLEYRPFIHKNIMDCIKQIVNAILEIEPGLVNDDNGIVSLRDVDAILEYEVNINANDTFDQAIAGKIAEIYSKPQVKEFIRYHQGSFYLIDSSSYFLSNLERITQPDYIPTNNDVLRTRKKTSGIYDFKFQMGSGLNVQMYDVGGQRSERKKWIHCFDNVTLIIFCVALSEYDQVLLEENSQNRLEESLTLFDSVVNSRWFARTSIVLFLNKIDVFADKLPYSPLEKHFPDYNGGNNINKAAKYILWRFTQVNRSGLNIYPHVTQATDTSNIELVFAAVKETILENSLKDSGLL